MFLKILQERIQRNQYELHNYYDYVKLTAFLFSVFGDAEMSFVY